MDKNKVLNLVGTGTAVGALLIIATLFSNGGFKNGAAASSVAADMEPAPIVQVNESADLESQNAQLQEALIIMQEREAEYEARLNEANDMLMNPEPIAAAYGEGEGEEMEEEDEMEEEGEEMEDENEMEEEGEEMEDENEMDDDEDEDEMDEDDEGGILGLDLGLGFGEKDD